MTRLVSKIYSMGEAPPRTSAEIEEDHRQARRKAWHELGLAVLDPEDINDDWLRQALINEADRKYGRRIKGAGK